MKAFGRRGFVGIALGLALAGCAALPTPFCLHEINAVQDALEAAAAAATAHDWEAFAACFEERATAVRFTERLRKRLGVEPAAVTLSRLRVETLQGDRATARAFVSVEPPLVPENAVASWAEFLLAKRAGRWQIVSVEPPRLHKWEGVYRR